MHLNLTFSEFDGPIIERVNEFVYLESYTKTAHAAHDVDTRIAKARAAIYSFHKYGHQLNEQLRREFSRYQ